MRLRASGLAFGFVFVTAIACSPDVDDLSGGPPVSATCGNGVLDPGEACDDARIVTQTCADLVGPKSTGNVRCTACGFDLRGCLGAAQGGAAGATGKGGAAGGAGAGGAASGGATSAGSAGAAGTAGTAGASASGAGGAGGGGGGAAGGSAGTGGGGNGGASGMGPSGAGGTIAAGTGGASAGSGGVTSAGAAGTTSGGSAGSTSGGSSGSASGAAGSGGSGASCAPTCAPFLSCQGGVCVCGPESVSLGPGCWPLSPSPPASRTKAEVCAARAMGVQELAASEVTKNPGTCGPHLPSLARLGDVGNRLAYYRWLVGMPPVAPGLVAGAASRDHAECAAAVSKTASPMAGSTCATEGALSALSHSYRYRSSFGLDVIDEYVRDAFPGGPQDSFRLGILRQYVKPFWWGEFDAGTEVGGTCLDLPESVTATTLGKSIWPPPGPVPVELAGQRWTIGPLIPNAIPSVKVTEVGSTKTREVQASLEQDTHDNGPYAVLTRKGWVPLVGTTYQVALSQGGDVVVSYAFTPIECSP